MGKEGREPKAIQPLQGQTVAQIRATVEGVVEMYQARQVLAAQGDLVLLF